MPTAYAASVPEIESPLVRKEAESVHVARLTALNLYWSDPGFRGFMAQWVEDRRCPFPLADYLSEREMENQARCAAYCATAPEQSNCEGDCFGVFPIHEKIQGQPSFWYWFVSHRNQSIVWCNQISPDWIILKIDSRILTSIILRSESSTAAILKLMDVWK